VQGVGDIVTLHRHIIALAASGRRVTPSAAVSTSVQVREARIHKPVFGANWRVVLSMTVEKVLEPDTEQAEIVSLIEAETAAFLNWDVDALCDCWVQEPYLQHTTIVPYCGVVQVNGIAGLRDHFLAHFRNEKPLEIETEAIVRKNWQFVVRKNMAWVTFEQSGSSDNAAHMSGLQMHTRILEKVSGYWKLVSSTGVLSRLDYYDCPKIHVDGSANILQATDESREVVSIHPALKISGGRLSASLQKDAAKLKKAIQLAQKDVEDGNARLPTPLIFGEETGSHSSLCWIAILDLNIVILLDDIRTYRNYNRNSGSDIRTQREANACRRRNCQGRRPCINCVYTGGSPNTVRTHVKRLFERVGVNSQKALLKRLLSSQAPAIGQHY